MSKTTEKANRLKNNKIIIISIIALILIVIIATVIIINHSRTNENKANTPKYVEKIEEGVKLNKSNKMKEEKKLGDISIKNVQLITKSGITSLTADVTNTGENKTNMKIVEVKLLDENNETLTTVTGIISELEPKGKTNLNISMTSDFINAYDYTISEK